MPHSISFVFLSIAGNLIFFSIPFHKVLPQSIIYLSCFNDTGSLYNQYNLKAIWSFSSLIFLWPLSKDIHHTQYHFRPQVKRFCNVISWAWKLKGFLIQRTELVLVVYLLLTMIEHSILIQPRVRDVALRSYCSTFSATFQTVPGILTFNGNGVPTQP